MIVKYPDPILDTVGVSPFGETDIENLCRRMRRECWEVNGLGISAVQIGEPYSIFGYYSSVHKDLLWIVNPEIVSMSGGEWMDEGCLSIPGFFWKTFRPNQITINYEDVHGEPHTKSFKGLEARIVQHELDHLDGVLLVDLLDGGEYFSEFKKYYNADDPRGYNAIAPKIDTVEWDERD